MKETYHSKSAPAVAPRPVSKTVRYRAPQEHMLRRLGGALVIQWDALPDELQDLLIDQAALVQDREDAANTTADIERFIRNAKVVPTAKPAAAAAPAQT